MLCPLLWKDTYTHLQVKMAFIAAKAASQGSILLNNTGSAAYLALSMIFLGFIVVSV